MKYLKFFLFILCLSSAENYGQRKVFNGIENYLTQTAKETGFEEKKIIVLSKEDYYSIGEEIVTNELYTFYGIVYNSELISASKLRNKSCWGQFLELCKNVEDGNVGTKIDTIPYLKNIGFSSDKKTLVFLYSQQLGKSGIKKNIKPVMEAIQKDSSFDYIVLSLDTMIIK